jgi:hypothetical protein
MTRLEDGIAVEFTLTPDTIVGHTYRQTGEDDYADQPVTLADAVVERIADKMLARVEAAAKERFGGYGAYGAYGGIVESKIGPAVDVRVEKIVADLMERSLTRTDPFGTPKGEETTLEEVITARVEKWLKQAQGDSYSKKGSPLEQALAKLIDRDMQTALNKVIAEAQQKALATVSATAEQALVQGLRSSIAKMAAQA